MNSRLSRSLIIICVVALVLGVGNMLSGPEEDLVIPAESHQKLSKAQKESLAVLAPHAIQARPKPTTSPGVSAKAYIALEPGSNYPLIEKNADMHVPIASTTKIMTSLVAMDSYDLDRVITIPREAAGIEGSEVQLLTNETMTVKNLLYALLIQSANDGAMTLALADGDKDAFIAKMNAKAELLGLTNTHYRDPAGLNDEGYSSARDLAILTQYALKNELFRTIVQTAKYTVWSSDNRYKHDLTNSNRLVVPQEALYLPTAIGVKTGTTDAAGHCLVAAAKLANNDYVVSVVLNTTEYSNSASAKESRKLLTWAQNILNKI